MAGYHREDNAVWWPTGITTDQQQNLHHQHLLNQHHQQQLQQQQQQIQHNQVAYPGARASGRPESCKRNEEFSTL